MKKRKHQFTNTTPTPHRGLWDVVKWQFAGGRSKWPAWLVDRVVSRLNEPLVDDEIRATFVGHATLLVQTAQSTFLTDPVWSSRCSPVTWAGPQRVHAPGIAFQELPKIDFVVISHNHYDHLDLPTLSKLEKRDQPEFFVPLGNREWMLNQGLSHVQELDWWGNVRASTGAEITLVPSQHFSGRGLWDRDKTLWGSFLIRIGKRQIFFGGDTGYSDHFKQIAEKLGPVDLSLLPIGAYAPQWFMKPVHMNPEEAVQAHLDLGSRQSIGIHFGTFQLTDEPREEPADRLRLALTKAGIPLDRFTAPQVGETLRVLPHPPNHSRLTR